MTPRRKEFAPDSNLEEEQNPFITSVVGYIVHGEPEATELDTDQPSTLSLITQALADSDQPRTALELAREAWQKAPDRAHPITTQDKNRHRDEVARYQILTKALYVIESRRRQFSYDANRDPESEYM
jgi:hypothetical protein